MYCSFRLRFALSGSRAAARQRSSSGVKGALGLVSGILFLELGFQYFRVDNRLPEVEFFGLGRRCRIRCIVREGMRGDFVIPAVVHEPVDGLMA